MNTSKIMIAPIAVDLGATNTGVYSAFYQSGAIPQEINQEGRVYTLGKDDYTLLMKQRTAQRHQRRGFDRRQMAKRLFRLIWTEEFKLEWDDDIAKLIGFLFNRRGFSYLAIEYSLEELSRFPEEDWEKLPKAFRAAAGVSPSGGFLDFSQGLKNWAEELRAEELLEKLCTEQKIVKKDLLFYDRTQKLRQNCKLLLAGKNFDDKKKHLSQVSSWIVEKWVVNGVQGLPLIEKRKRSIDLRRYLEGAAKKDIKIIADTLPDYSTELKDLKNSPWNFNEKSFTLEKADFSKNETLFHHLAFALYSVNEEIQSGAKYRKKYFEEISELLQERKHKHRYMRDFCAKLHGKNFGILNAKNLCCLIGHISNLELKPLRKYFNDPNHKNKDYWDESQLRDYVGRWILKEWRVDLENNPEKSKDKEQDYGALCQRWKTHQGTLVDFWMKESPVSTIPPYQNNNNRRPPRCQSLILSGDFLDADYPKWRTWLTGLMKECPDYLEGYQNSLQALRTGKGQPYFKKSSAGEAGNKATILFQEDVDGRLLHFIFDRRKDNDPFFLNEIYSHAKKIRQLKQDKNSDQEKLSTTSQKLTQACRLSQVPKSLKTEPDFNTASIFKEGSFFHLLCRYYKLRQRARDARLFLHPSYKKSHRGYEGRHHFDTRKTMLRYCNQKPRQKKYQSLEDVAGVLQVKPDFLFRIIGSKEDEKIQEWLKGFKVGKNGLEGMAKKCAEAQKEHRGNLKILIARKTNNILNKLVENVALMSKEIGTAISDGPDNVHWKKFSSVFSFAQLYNIAFKERSGNSNTCPVCSLDNSLRMENILSEDDGEYGAKAQRIPAISMRLIDGAVMRMIRILTKRITQDRWPRIESALRRGHEVRVPIITESNRFEFEPALNALKGREDSKQEKKKTTSKVDRIKEFVKYCPYTGKELGAGGEIDHIIPCSSKWGTLNDETNLIYVSKTGNQQKKEVFYSLDNLHPHYKQNIFGSVDHGVIEKKILDSVWDKESKNFSFGKYRSFIDLDLEQQKGFRHALFLIGHPVRDKVIAAINNRNRSLVNGTQRYFAEMLANELHKKSLDMEKADLLSFDYFTIEAFSSSKGQGIRDWREIYELIYPGQLEAYKKRAGQRQEAYSHLMDAQIAFLLAADEHRKEGSLRLDIPDAWGVFPGRKETGEVLDDNLFKAVWVKPEEMQEAVELKRRKPEEGFRRHRSFTRDTFYAVRYLAVLLKLNKEKKPAVRVGFDWGNSVEWTMNKKNQEFLNQFLGICSQRKNFAEAQDQKGFSLEALWPWLFQQKFFQDQVKTQGFIRLTVDRQFLHEFWIKEFNTRNGRSFDDFSQFCYYELGYRTEKKKIVFAQEDAKNNINTLLEESKNFTVTFLNKKINLPFKKAWEELADRWEQEKNKDNSLDFLRSYFKSTAYSKHQRARKVFSLPVKTGEGRFLLRRQGWNGKDVFQMVNDSDSRAVENKPVASTITTEGDLGEMLLPWVQSKNLMKPSKENYSTGTPINSQLWFPLDPKKIAFPEDCTKIWIRIDDKTAPSIAIKLGSAGSDMDPALLIQYPLCRHGFRSQKAKEKTADEIMREEFWDKEVRHKKKGEIIRYKGSKGYDRLRKEALKTAKEPVEKPM